MNHAKLTVDLNETEYVQELLERFNRTNCLPVSTPMVQCLSVLNSSEKKSAEDQALYCDMVDSLLYPSLACWSRPNISTQVYLLRYLSTQAPTQVSQVDWRAGSALDLLYLGLSS